MGIYNQEAQIMSKNLTKKWLAELIHANRGRMTGRGNYQTSRFKAVVLTIDGQKVELDRREYEAYIAKIKEEKRKPIDEQKRFDPLTGEPL